MVSKQLQKEKRIYIVTNFAKAPPASFEYAYYVVVGYALLNVAWGLDVPLLGAGMLAALAAACILRLGSRAIAVYAPIALPLGCVISVITIQISLHGESLMGDGPRAFITWLLALIVVQSLTLREGFLHRFALAAFVIGVVQLPYLTNYQRPDYEVARLGLSAGIGLANPNILAMWFGFCCIYFMVVGVETKRNIVRVASWLVAAGCLYIVGITVSRGPLLGIAIAIVFALRRLLKRGFTPILCLLALSWIVFALGVFDRLAGFYAARGMEETGRLILWPLALERFSSSPLAGVGLSQISLIPNGKFTGPHNGFLYIALASGILPLAFFLAYWIRSALGAFRASANRLPDASFQIPLFIFAFLEMMTSDATFMSPWHIVLLSTILSALSARIPLRVRRIEKLRESSHAARLGGARYAIAGYRVRGSPSAFRRTWSK